MKAQGTSLKGKAKKKRTLAPKTNSKLTQKQKIFCEEYILDWNATRAATVAGYSEKTARVIGAQNLTKLYIKNYVEEIQKDLAKIAGISRLKVLKEHQKLAFSSFSHIHNTWIERKRFEELLKTNPEIFDCIESIESSVETKNIGGKNAANQKFIDVETVKVKLYSKQKSLDSISKMLGYNEPEKIEHSGEMQALLLPFKERK